MLMARLIGHGQGSCEIGRSDGFRVLQVEGEENKGREGELVGHVGSIGKRSKIRN